MSDHNALNNHGHSAAAWTGVVICLIGAFLCGLGILINQNTLAIAGAVIFLAGGVVGWIMGKAAKGKAAKTHTTGARHAA